MARLNVQGLARRDKEFMSCLLATPNTVVISSDLGAGEPTVTAHFSQDVNYRYATFDGVGHAPFWLDNVLMIDDIYIMSMSKSPVGREQLLRAWNKDYNGMTFAEQWLKDKDVIAKKELKFERELHKTLALGIGYGMGAPKMVRTAHDKGFKITHSQAKAFINSYWSLFPSVKAFSDRLGLLIKKQGYMVNSFGYRLVPKSHKSFNYLIQSSVSGLMHLILAKVFEICPDLIFITVIHDELLLEVDIAKVDQAKAAMDKAVEWVNKELNWTTKVRVGWVVGNNWYEAK